jgi:hypothetical protein
MKLPELFEKADLPDPNFQKFLRSSDRQPPLDPSRLAIDALVRIQRQALRTTFGGICTLVLRYKGQESALTSIDEDDAGEQWLIDQVQGARSRKSYRVATGLRWQRLFGERINDYAHHPEAEVRQITMPKIDNISNIDEARSTKVGTSYDIVRDTLGMRYSDKLGLYVTDVKRDQ